MHVPNSSNERGERPCLEIARDPASDAQGPDRVRWDGRLRNWHVSSRGRPSRNKLAIVYSDIQVGLQIQVWRLVNVVAFQRTAATRGRVITPALRYDILVTLTYTLGITRCEHHAASPEKQGIWH